MPAGIDSYFRSSVEPDDFVALELDHRSKIVVASAGGPDLFESMQEASPSDLTYEDDEGDEGDFAEDNIDPHASRSSHVGAMDHDRSAARAARRWITMQYLATVDTA
jgi:hypothetical protein